MFMIKHREPSFPDYSILIVDDEETALKCFEVTLRVDGINNLLTCKDSRNVFSMIKENSPGIVILDLCMPHISGQELLPQIVKDFPDIFVIILTGNNEIETAVDCMRQGAFDYIVKPVGKETLVARIKNCINHRELKYENRYLRNALLSDGLKNPKAFSEIVTQNRKMLSLFQYTEAIAKTSYPVLITGETGVGKDLLAKAIHVLSEQKGKFVPINIAGMDDTIFSDTLFGHKKGAFTGAIENRDGLVKKASLGTLFLDEIGDLSLESQVKLLRFIQDKEYNPIGSDLTLRSDAKVVLATNQDLIKLKDNGRFRKDLYYRLCSHHIHIPPLRERKDDLSLLTDYYFEKISKEKGIKKPFYSSDLITLLSIYDFPGNIRELIAMIQKAINHHKGKNLSFNVFKEIIGYKENDSDIKKNDVENVIFPEKLPTLKKMSELLISEAIKRSKGNQTIAANIIGITQQALNKRLKKNQ